jgi:hypothetical protein
MQCKKQLWAGQRGAGFSRGHIYTGESHLAALDNFLFEHIKHPLAFQELQDYFEFEGRTYSSYELEEVE